MSDNYNSVRLPNGYSVRKAGDYQYEIISPAKIIYRITNSRVSRGAITRLLILQPQLFTSLDLSALESKDSSIWFCDCQIQHNGPPCKHIKMLLSVTSAR